MLKTIKLSIFFGLALIILSSTAGVFAQGNSAANSNRNNIKEVNPVAAANRSDKATVAQNRVGSDAAMMKKNNLSAARLRVCEARQERISNRFTNLLTLGTRAQQNFKGFVARVDYYYINSMVPQGYVLDNYDELMADIEANELAVMSAIEAVGGVGQVFSCSLEDPKGTVDAFRANMQQVIAANKEYKNSVRAYVAAVRDLAIQIRTDKLSTIPEDSADATSAAEIIQ